MHRPPEPALFVAVLVLSCPGGLVADDAGSTKFHRLCEELIGRVVTRGGIRFAEGSAELKRPAFGTLDEIVEIAADCPALSITVTGHTDDTGNENFNLALSRKRAESVVEYLTMHGVEPGRLKARGAGSESPVASNDLPAGRQQNRRIEFELSLD